MDRMSIARRFREHLQSPEIVDVILYGSVARGEDKKGSDIDLLVISHDKFLTKAVVREKVGDFFLEL
jgi:predicted nucleotidyltransferase